MAEAKATILIVDDVPQVLTVLTELLTDTYMVTAVADGPAALGVARSSEQPDLILLDVNMPEMNGFEVCRRLKADTAARDIPVIFLTSLGEMADEEEGFAVGAVDFLTKPANPGIMLARIATHVALRAARKSLANRNAILETMVTERSRQLMITQDVAIQTMASLAETRDNETAGHIHRTQLYVRLLAEELGKDHQFQMAADTIDMMCKSVPLHDVGKLGIPDHILLKPSRLSDSEFEEMKLHTVYGRDAILTAEASCGRNSFFQWAREIAYCHHEKWDGSGYPQGMEEESIPLSARFMALADVYDTVMGKRVYKKPFSHTKATAIIKAGGGSQFDPRIVNAFLKIEGDFRRIAIEHADSDEERAAAER